ncbi:MAG: DUF6090 family protein, partial [Saprospiraceae bacterium]|nr:DUF6090 family protein [Saprospiraceae bacterium]
MLIFLRKIRKSLIESGSTRKYVLYAIGEIALVVIGILIALQINNWNDQLISKRIEQKLLDGIKEELLVNKNQLEDVILNHEVAVDCSRKVLELYHHDIQTLDSEVVDSLVDGIISYWTFNPRLGFIKSIISSGRLG